MADSVPDLAYVIACASKASGLEWDGSMPKVVEKKSNYLPLTSVAIDRSGKPVLSTGRMVGQYRFGTDEAQFSLKADMPAKAHEMTHFLQDLSGMDPGNAKGAKEKVEQRGKIEAQAYEVERLSPFECQTLLGKWKQDVKDLAESKRKEYLLKSKGADDGQR